ncbi:hypothetical protein TWF191_003004 [Orbilia oligospora]|uniref:Uncharacterized protein n=1 Tax=Orbilia oligospora TaxID=2813651 RepID=A0A7C8QZ82_ORBOL|nr:hypothetical protein TWF191_003004 [Orbilia oligospora]
MNQDRGARPPHQTWQQGKEIDTDDEESDPEPLLIIRPEEITVAIFCALSCESVAVKYALDEEFQCRPKSHPNARKYIYSFGQIGSHKVLIARPNQMGKVNAAGLSATISQQFPNVRFALMIGIGAGIPNKRDIRLGDIAVSIPRENHPGVIEYDFGKLKKDGFTLKGCLNKPPSILLSADGQLDEDERMNKRPFRKILRNIIKQPGYERPNTADVLFDPSFHHVNEGNDCSGCEASNQKIVIDRTPRIDGEEVEEMITIKEAMAQIETKVDIINQNLDDLQREVYNNHRETKHTEILEWVCPGAALSARHSTIVSARQAGTAGAGKSTISSVVIDYLEEQRKQDPTTQTAVAYFYFDFSNKEIGARIFTRNLLKQLAFQSPNFPQGLTELSQTYSGSGKTEAEDQKIEDLLIESASNFKYTYIVVDALDECAPEQRFNVLNIIQRLAGSGGARVFATSRPHPEDINEVFKEVNKIELGARADDIRKYIKAEIRRQATLSRIEATLDQILKMSASKGFQPIDETFNLMLESIDECNRDIADKALSWLLVTKYPLRIQDLLVALAIEPGVFEIAEYQQLQQTTVLDVCAGFIVVDESNGIVKLAHQTVQGYLLRKTIDTADALTSLTKACLNYLRFHQFANSKFVDSLGDNEGTGLDSLTEMPFYLYALRNWEAQISECNQTAIEEDLVAFLNHDLSIISYCHARKLSITNDEQAASNRWHWFYCVSTDESPLHIAARVGHLGTIKYFLSTGIDVNIKNNGGHQPVWEALAHGRIEAMKLLVENGSSPRTTWRQGRQLIHFASARGDYAAVKYLLEIDHKIVNIQQSDGSSPLRECAVYGHEDVACLLLDSGADWLLETYDRRTAGFISLERGQTNIFSLLLKRGFSLKNPVARGLCNSGTPLHVAAGYGYQEIVKEILELGAINPQNFDISLSDSRGNTALHNAVNTGLLPVVQLLVENGIDIERKNKDGKTALDLAIEFGYSPVERYLRSAILASSWDILELDNATTLQNSNTTSEPSTMADVADVADGISPSDIATVYEILIQKLNLPTIATRKIMDYAEYWVEQYVKKSGTVVVDETCLPVPYLHLNICGSFIRRIVFRTMSHDQGWSDERQNHGAYLGSCTWIEVRRTPKDHNVIESSTKKADGGDKKIASINTRELQRNIHARWTSTEHINQWDMATAGDPELVDFLSNLSLGDRISLHPKAQYMGWKCYLDEAEMWVYSSPWDRQYS